MPKYRFLCSSCSFEVEKFTSNKTTEVPCPACSAISHRQLPSNGSQAVTEVMDDFTGVRRDQNHEELKKERKEQYYWEVEVPRFVETYSIETCLEQGWLVYNDKGELVIGKPPSKR